MHHLFSREAKGATEKNMVGSSGTSGRKSGDKQKANFYDVTEEKDCTTLRQSQRLKEKKIMKEFQQVCFR